MSSDSQLLPPTAEESRLRTLAHVVYALQAFAFLVVVTPIVGVIINYVKWQDAAGTFYESHFRWQIRTFWWALGWQILGGMTVFLGIGFFILLAAGIWYIYRIVKGWLRLSENKPMY